jgi:uncharacterized protein YegP (UPF0339 family)
MQKFLITNGKDGQFYFVLQARNGRTILSSEGYTSKKACLHGIKSVKANSLFDARYERHTADNEQFYFILKASNKKVIGKSQMYSSPSCRYEGINVVKRIASIAPVIFISRTQVQ